MHALLLVAAVLAASMRGPEEPPPAEAAAEEAEPQTETRIVLLAIPGTDDAARTEAIAAHLSGLDVVVDTIEIDAMRGELVAKHALADGAARARGAIAAYWVESPRAGTLELYVVQPGRRAVLRREVSLDPDAPEASIEALGVVARSITSALVADADPDMESIPLPEPVAAPAPEPEPAPPPPERTRGRARLALGYVGTSYAKQLAWQSGLGFSAGWVWPFGLHLAADYTLMQRVRSTGDASSIVITRHPIAAAIGYGHRFRSLYVEGEAVATLDYAVRRGTSSSPVLSPAPDRGHTTFGLGPRGRLAVIAGWRVELYLQAGVEFWLSTVRYAVESAAGQTDVLLQPRRVRAHTGAGVAVRI